MILIVLIFSIFWRGLWCEEDGLYSLLCILLQLFNEITDVKRKTSFRICNKTAYSPETCFIRVICNLILLSRLVWKLLPTLANGVSIGGSIKKRTKSFLTLYCSEIINVGKMHTMIQMKDSSKKIACDFN